MFGLDPNQSFEFLERTVLLQLCVGQNELIFRFDGDIELAVESELRIRNSRFDQRFSKSIEAARVAIDFLGREVSAVKARPDGTLNVEFGTAMSIEVYDSSMYYESYTLTWPKGLIVV